MEEQENKTLKKGFFKKVWNSISKIEKYPDMAAEGLGRAFIYMCKLVAILAIVICLGIMYQTYQMIQEGTNYLQNEFPDFSSEEEIIIPEENSYVGKTIIDTKVQDEQTINSYINEIEDAGNGIIILKDKIILKNNAVSGTISYNYNEILGQMKITQFTKQIVQML